MAVDPRTPVLVGSGVAHQKFDDPADAREPVELMALAAERAAEDAGAPGVLAAADSIIVPKGSWRYPDPGRLLAQRFGANDARTVLAEFGILQLTPFTRACRAIASGAADVVLVVGGEARFRDLRGTITGAGAPETEQGDVTPDELLVPAHEIITRQEIEAKLTSAPLQYSIIETAWRAAHGQSVDGNVRETADLWARFAAIAAANPDAWKREGFDADFLATVSEKNPMIAAPYRKWNVSQWNVDQASAFVLCAAEVADRFGVPDDRRVYPHAIVEGNHMVPMSKRAVLHRSPQVQLNGERLRELTGIAPGDADLVDLYSCFPVAVRLQARELGVRLDPAPTLTGGMTFAGGPLNNYVLQAMVRLVHALREDPATLALSTSVSGMLTKQGGGVWSGRPSSDPFRAADVSAIAAQETAVVDVDPEATGHGSIAGYTVAHGRERAPAAIALVDLDDGSRALAVSEDADHVAELTRTEGVGRTADVSGVALRGLL
jgi:acetyl-CoA C-acetyltransferase